MKTNSHTDKLFEQMRTMPPEIPLENVEQFVLAQAAVGITAMAASKSIFTKAFIKFHLNTLLIMTSTIAASIISFFIWHNHHQTAEQASTKNSRPEYTAAFTSPKIAEADTPKVSTVQTVKDGETISVTTIKTENGTNIKVITNGNEETKVYYNTPNDTGYTYAYATTNPSAEAAVPATPPVMAQTAEAMANMEAAIAVMNAQLAQMEAQAELASAETMSMDAEAPSPCMIHTCFQDTLMNKLETTLMKDGLISDTLHYSFKINGSYMKVNGEKVDKEVWKKYRDFIESNSLNKVNKKFSYAILRDGDDTTINVENYIN